MDSITKSHHLQDLEISQPWDRQPGEPARWFARFERYCYMDPGYRSLSALWKEEKRKKGQDWIRGKPSRHWENAARRWSWAERAAAWDQHHKEMAISSLEGSWIELLELVPAAVETLLELLSAEESGQRRMAAESILRLSGLGNLSEQEDSDSVTPISLVRVDLEGEVEEAVSGDLHDIEPTIPEKVLESAILGYMTA